MCLKKCCFCVDLRVGSLISGYVMLVYNVGMLVNNIVIMYLMYVVSGSLDETYKATFLFKIYTLVFGVTTFFVILELLFTIALLVGLHKNKPRPVLVYIISTVTLQLIGLLLRLWFVANNYSKYTITEWTPTILHCLALFFYVFFLSVFGSYRKKMCREQSEEKSYYV